MLNALVLVTALLMRLAHCCQAARQDLCRGRSVDILAAQIRGSIERLRDTNYANLPDNHFVPPLLKITGQGDVALGLLEGFVGWKEKVPEHAFDEIYKLVAAEHSSLISLAHGVGVQWAGYRFSGDFSADVDLWKA